MRRVARVAVVALLLAGPTAIAFRSGGYFAQPRLWAAIVAWLLVLGACAAGAPVLPRRLGGRLAVAGLALIAAWSALSLLWAPQGGPAIENVQRLVLYVGFLLAGVAWLRAPRARAAVEPTLAAGAFAVIGYGLAGRLLPGLLHLERSARAGGRLEQPLTYWNAEGALAAMGFVLCARLAGDERRSRAVRILAAAAAGPLGAGIYLSYSRGAIAAGVAGLVVLLAAAPSQAQARAAAATLVAGVVGAAACAALPGVASLEGSLGARERDGLIALAVLVAVAAAAALVTARAARTRRPEPVPGARRLPAVAVAVAVLALAGLVAGGLRERAGNQSVAGATASRLTSVSSNRYYYWRVGLRDVAHHPLLGVGSGGFRVSWLRERTIHEGVLEVHSLELEMAAELGLVGLAALGVMLGGLGLATRRALRADALAAVGPLAAFAVWLIHASIDWDWQMPAVTLPALALAAVLIVLGDGDATGARADAEPSARAAVAAPAG